jgi:hypothetical protein
LADLALTPRLTSRLAIRPDSALGATVSKVVVTLRDHPDGWTVN